MYVDIVENRLILREELQICTVIENVKREFFRKKKEEEFEGLESHIIQHEIDHLDGIEEKFIDEENKSQLIKQHNINRNDPCPCGSRKKFEKCCMNSISTYY